MHARKNRKTLLGLGTEGREEKGGEDTARGKEEDVRKGSCADGGTGSGVATRFNLFLFCSVFNEAQQPNGILMQPT